MQMSPNHLPPQMQKAFLLLQVLPLQAFISSDIPFVLSTPKEKQIREKSNLLSLSRLDNHERANGFIVFE